MHETFNKLTFALALALLAMQVNAGPCNIFVPANCDIAVTTKKCKPGAVCYLESCEGTVSVPAGAPAAHVFFKNLQKKSDVAPVRAGATLDLATLEIGGAITSSIKQLGSAQFSPQSKSEVGGRSALGEGDSMGAPSGTIAIGPDGDLVFVAQGNAAGQVYEFSSSSQGAPQRFSADASGLVRIPARLLQPDRNYRGGFQGATNVPFTVTSSEKLTQLHAALGAIADEDPVSARYRKALLLLDNGFSWNAQQLLGGTDQAL